ncbi:MAG: PDZ domain-containing protein [Fimbriimonadaceae bacterium]|nr:PDZ domain-containing protein [Fimbriimonadaceae bacterium]
MRRRWPGLGLLALLPLLPLRAAEVPEELFFGVAGLQRRMLLTPPQRVQSGSLTVELLEVDSLVTASEPQVRLLLRCRQGGPSATPLVVVGEVYALDEAGRELPARSRQSYQQGEVSWVVVTLPAARRLSLFSTALGPAPREEQRTERLPLTAGSSAEWPAVGLRGELALLRQERTRLPLASEAPPLYRGLDSTALRSEDPPEPSGDSSFVTLRLATLGPLESPVGWRLANLRLTAGQQVVQDWRYRRLLWRPDWGAWLGAKGRDWESSAEATPRRGVLLESLVAGGPGELAGLRVGDVLLTAAGLPLPDAYGLGELVRTQAPGAVLRCEVWRDGRRLPVTIRLGGRELWPDLDEVEFKEAWTRLGGGEQAVLSLWDWQTWAPLPGDLAPTALELVFSRLQPVAQTQFVLRNIPLQAPQSSSKSNN